MKLKLKSISTYFGWIASLFLICFAIVFTFNPAPVNNFLEIKNIPYSFLIGLALLGDGVLTYYFHYLEILKPYKRRLLWLPAILIFYGLSFYSSTTIGNSLASYMFFSLASLYLILLILNNNDLEFSGRPINVGLMLVNIAAVFFAIIIFLDPARYINFPSNYLILVKIIAICLIFFSSLTVMVGLFYKQKVVWPIITAGVFLTILFSCIATNFGKTQAVLPFFVWLGMFFRPYNSSSTNFVEKTGSI